MITQPIKRPLKQNKLILPSLVLAGISVLAIPFTVFRLSTQIYLVFFLPIGIVAAVLARIAISQVKRGLGTRQDFKLAIIAYFMGLSPSLCFCGLFTYALVSLWW